MTVFIVNPPSDRLSNQESSRLRIVILSKGYHLSKMSTRPVATGRAHDDYNKRIRDPAAFSEIARIRMVAQFL